MATHDLTFPLLVNHLKDIADRLGEELDKTASFLKHKTPHGQEYHLVLMPLYNLIFTIETSTQLQQTQEFSEGQT